MKPRASGRKGSRIWLSGGIAATLTALVGLALFLFPIGGGITRSSFDLPFALRGSQEITNAAIIYLDEASHTELNQPMMLPWDRSLHARLINQLTAQGARAIVFDILFTEASANPTADEQLAQAIKQSGRVILAGNFQERETSPGAVGRWEELPYEPFRNVIAGWGNANLTIDPDYGIRSFFPTLQNISGVSTIPWLPSAVAKFTGASENAVRSDLSESRWLNYYGPPGSFPSYNYFQALQSDGTPPGFFKGKIVFVGAQLSADFSGKGKDEFLTPYAYWGKGFAPGVEIHATAALNLLRGDWLNRFPFVVELGLLLLVALLAGFGLIRLQPLTALLLTLAAMAMVAVGAHYLAWRHHLWFAWLIVICQMCVALLCSVIYNSLHLYVDKKLLEQSLAAHLSPKVLKRLIKDPAARQVGGSLQEVSILFTDIANFSRISESMNPDDLVRLMNKYFETALRCIHETDGTIVKLIGDAIFAIWNAPVAQPDHRERASQSALRLREQLVEFDAAERSLPLRTRAGLHSGEACVGNIGSTTRYDYTAIGDCINLTSRLEGLNKQLGTDVLATREIQRAGEKSLVWRLVGHFKFKGFGRAVEVHELVGPLESAEQSSAWRGKFSDALQDFRQRNFDGAAVKFQAVIELRRVVKPDVIPGTSFIGGDGPSRFYLEKIAALRANPPPYEWIGEVILDEK